MKARFPLLAKLTRRQLEMLHLTGIRGFPDSSFRSIDLSQNLGFAHASLKKVGCVTPQGQKYLSTRVRLVTGSESLHLQHMPFFPHGWSPYKQSFLQDLAGNAFELSCAGACLLSSLVMLAMNRKARLHNEPCKCLVASPDDENNNNDDVQQDKNVDASMIESTNDYNYTDLDDVWFGSVS